MLVLQRKANEKVILSHPGLPGGRIVVVVTSVDRNKVRLGFACDKEVVILREELLPEADAN